MDSAAFRRNALLGVAEMYAADKAAMAAGVSGDALMEAAGKGVADAVLALVAGPDLITGQVVTIDGGMLLSDPTMG